MQFQFSQLSFPPDTEVVLRDVSWQDYEKLMAEIGDRPALRIHYTDRSIHLMSPSFTHENPKWFLRTCIEYLLEQQGVEFLGAGSVTLRKSSVEKAVEPDECFYIEHEAVMRDKHGVINLDVDPPPDLALEVDISSKTSRDLYAALGVPELWIFDGERLQLWVLQAGQYVAVPFSPHFPHLDVATQLPLLLKLAQREGRRAAMQALRAWAAAG